MDDTQDSPIPNHSHLGKRRVRFEAFLRVSPAAGERAMPSIRVPAFRILPSLVDLFFAGVVKQNPK